MTGATRTGPETERDAVPGPGNRRLAGAEGPGAVRETGKMRLQASLTRTGAGPTLSELRTCPRRPPTGTTGQVRRDQPEASAQAP